MKAMTRNAKHNAATKKRLKWGDKVAVPWGFDEIVGEVIEVYGPSPRHRYAKVLVPVHGPDGETLAQREISFPQDSLRLVA